MFEENIKYPILFQIPKNRLYKNLGVHSFFMKFPIDIIFVNNTLEIVDKTSLKPWKYYKIKENVSFFIELEEGYSDKHNIQIKDKIKFI